MSARGGGRVGPTTVTAGRRSGWVAPAVAVAGILFAAVGVGLVTRSATSAADAVQVVDTLLGTVACAAGLALVVVGCRGWRRGPAASVARRGRDHPAGTDRPARFTLYDQDAEMRNVIPLSWSADASSPEHLRPASGQPWPSPRPPPRLSVVTAPAQGATSAGRRPAREDGCRPRRARRSADKGLPRA